MEMIEVGHKMKKEGLPSQFITGAVQTAFEFEGVYNLMKMWEDEKDSEERDEIVADIQGLIDDCAQKEKIEGAYVRFDDLGTIAKDIQKFKDGLRLIVDKNGGIGKLAELTGIPQPSLSRFFSSVAMPRRATLLKIAKALNLSQVQIATEWLR
ncbi:MAG: helix-turn-helix transcriptional regulator [Xanthomonadaceae bacterium]|nr:helix-turn-helix transcriptional regulator [Xanthomonadaceae bacterium]